MKDNVLQNSQDFSINFIANEDCLPKGGLPIICIFLYLFLIIL